MPQSSPPSLKTDYVRVTGQTDPIRLAKWIERFEPSIVFEVGSPAGRYAASLFAPGGVMLKYGRRNADGLTCPQSDARDAEEFCLEVPGASSASILDLLQGHHHQANFQCARRDVCMTFRPEDPEHIYRLFADLVLSGGFKGGRPAHRIGPDGALWESCSLQTHQQQSFAPRFAILYDKHSQNPDEYPDYGTLRLEFRWQPEKKEQKRIAFIASDSDLVDSWRFARTVLEVLTGQPRQKSLTYRPKGPDSDFLGKVQALVRSYGPTIALGVRNQGPAFLQSLALASVLSTEHAEFAKELPSVETMDS